MKRLRELVLQVADTGGQRELSGPAGWFLRWLAVGTATYHLYVGLWGIKQPLLHYSLHLSLLLAIGFLLYSFSQRVPADRVPWLDWGLCLASLGVGIYYAANLSRIEVRLAHVDPVTRGDLIFGILCVFLILEATRRLIGLPLLLVTLVCLAYLWFGDSFRGLLWHPSYSMEQLVDQLFLTSEGIFGTPVAASATYVFIFVLFGAFLEQSGAGNFFIKLALALAGPFRGGPAKVSVVSSALFGTISGSPVANVVADGPFTIPLMKRLGYSPAFAGAVEAVASTGGAIMPPVMGVAAFLMAEMTQIPYREIAISATLPALLYFVSLAMMIHFEALKKDLRPLPKAELPSLRTTLKEGVQFLVPIFSLLVLLAMGYTPMKTAVLAIGLCVLASWVRKETRMGARRILLALHRGSEMATLVLAACAAAGIVVGTISLTGFAGKLTSLVVSTLGQAEILALLFSMIVCLILGMGMPVSAAYVLTAVLTVPALLTVGIPLLPAHLFAVYFSAVSAITPPVAVAAYAAAGIARANPMRVGLIAVRLGLVCLIIPFFFVYQPALLLKGSFWEVTRAVVTSLAGAVLFAGGIQGWFFTSAGGIERVALVAAGLLLIHPGLTTDLLALPVAACVLFSQVRKARAQPAPPAWLRAVTRLFAP